MTYNQQVVLEEKIQLEDLEKQAEEELEPVLEEDDFDKEAEVTEGD